MSPVVCWFTLHSMQHAFRKVRARKPLGKPGGGPTQFRGDQRSGGGGDGAAARNKYRANATTAFCSLGGELGRGQAGATAL
jgi:hypothetical protein